VGAGGEAELVHRGAEEFTGAGVQAAVLADLAVGHVGVVAGRAVRVAEAGGLADGRTSPRPHRRARRAVGARPRAAKRHRGHFDVDVDPSRSGPLILAMYLCTSGTVQWTAPRVAR